MHLLLNILFKFVFGVTMLYCVTSITYTPTRTDKGSYAMHREWHIKNITQNNLSRYEWMLWHEILFYNVIYCRMYKCIWIFNSDPFLFSAWAFQLFSERHKRIMFDFFFHFIKINHDCSFFLKKNGRSKLKRKCDCIKWSNELYEII